jgi:hypothetical protein
MTKHKHYEAIMAWANGAAIEHQHYVGDRWADSPRPGWFGDVEYRVKPTPKPDIVHDVLIVCGMSCGPLLYAASALEANCVLVFDGKTHKLKGCSFKAA